MKRKILFVTILLAALFAFAQSDGTVYITAKGKKYHTQFCKTIKNSTVSEVTVEDAKKAGYAPCGVCKP